jgi:hypothetical protein
MTTLLLGLIAAASILGAAAPASAEYREVRIIRDWDRPPWARHFAWRGDCRDVTERRYRPDGRVEIRRFHRCDRHGHIDLELTRARRVNSYLDLSAGHRTTSVEEYSG